MDLKDITIRADGKWYYGDAEMFRRNILNILATHIEREEDGAYCIKLGFFKVKNSGAEKPIESRRKL